MILLINKNLDATYNLAFEEFFLKTYLSTEEIVWFWQNKKAIIIGRNQNYHQEINKTYVDANNIQVVRRLSGGGAVFHDLGNINFTFISNKNKNLSYQEKTNIIIQYLKTFNINAIFSGRNDILINNKKISGNAQYVYKNRIMHHGTLLFNVNLETLKNCLNPDLSKLKRKGIQSVKARVINIKPLLSVNINVHEFIGGLESYFINLGYKLFKIEKLIDEKINALATKKYRTKEWNIGKSPTWTNINKIGRFKKRFDGGKVDIFIQISNKKIENIKFFGDFLSKKDISILENNLENIEIKEIKRILYKLKNFNDYFGSLKKEEVIFCIDNALKASN